MTVPSATVVPGERASARRGRRAEARRASQPAGSSRTAGYFFVALLRRAAAALGIAPTVYAIALALSAPGGVGFAHFVDTFNVFEFAPAFEHILEFMGIWLVSQTILVVTLALMLHTLARRVSSAFRFVFYIPGALAGAASVVVWLFMFDPNASPFAFVLHGFGYRLFANTVAPGNLPVIFAIMAFWTGAGGWIVDHVRRAQQHSPGADRVRRDRRRERASDRSANQAPADPQVDRLHARAVVRGGIAAVRRAPDSGRRRPSARCSPYWSPNQLAYFVAFQQDRFNDAAAISVDLLVIGLVVAVLLVWRGKLFEVE